MHGLPAGSLRIGDEQARPDLRPDFPDAAELREKVFLK
jgi:hypothetical protein